MGSTSQLFSSRWTWQMQGFWLSLIVCLSITVVCQGTVQLTTSAESVFPGLDQNLYFSCLVSWTQEENISNISHVVLYEIESGDSPIRTIAVIKPKNNNLLTESPIPGIINKAKLARQKATIYIHLISFSRQVTDEALGKYICQFRGLKNDGEQFTQSSNMIEIKKKEEITLEDLYRLAVKNTNNLYATLGFMTHQINKLYALHFSTRTPNPAQYKWPYQRNPMPPQYYRPGPLPWQTIYPPDNQGRGPIPWQTLYHQGNQGRGPLPGYPPGNQGNGPLPWQTSYPPGNQGRNPLPGQTSYPPGNQGRNPLPGQTSYPPGNQGRGPLPGQTLYSPGNQERGPLPGYPPGQTVFPRGNQGGGYSVGTGKPGQRLYQAAAPGGGQKPKANVANRQKVPKQSAATG